MHLIEKTIRYIVLAGVFALPFIVFIVTPSLFFPFITGKNFAFRIIVEIITGSWLALAIVSVRYRPRRSWILLAFAILTLVIAIADLQGVNPFKSFWSNFERMDGWVTLAHLFAYLVVAISIIDTEKLWKRLWQVSLAVSLFVCIYGLLQLAGLKTLGQGGASGLTARLDSTFGNPIYLAAYLLFNIFIAALLWVQQRLEQSSTVRPAKGSGAKHNAITIMPMSFLYGGIIVIDTIVLFFTGTRGTILGLIGGVIVASILYLLSTRGAGQSRLAIGLLAGILVVSGGFWAIRTQGWVKDVGFLSRLATISLSDATTKSRLLNIGMAWQGVKEKPILGWGQENYAVVFDKYYDPRMYAQEPWFDRVHNIVMDWLVAGGFLGLLSYLSIFAAALWALWRGIFSYTDAFSSEEKSILTGLLAGYFFHDLFVFDNITSYILFATVLAYIAWREADARAAMRIPMKGELGMKALPVAALCGAALVWGSAWYVNARSLAENRALLSAIAPQSSGVLTNLENFKKAISYGTIGTQETREQLAQAASSIASAQNVANDVKQQFFDTAGKEMQLQAQESPLDARFPLFLGILLDSYGDYADGALALEKSHELSPKKQSILYEMGSNALARGDTKAALEDFKQAFELEESNITARLFYAAALIRTGNDALADQILAPALETGEAADARIAAAYAARGRYDKIVELWKARVKAMPDDSQSYFTLSAAYYAAGNSAQAIVVLQDVAKKIPSITTQAQTYIDQIRAGTAPKAH
ncbi:O-antigen ligase family protein [Candidatus Kaiserbacteria bacterium]|nr:O-antigen ligase family protein [Candidatus Kaiserbacteria bacterium]